ncbi:MAG: hypothetical protein J6Y71_03930 [Ruminococcus sp.]|nr:hypothetical protein [Ruminococcus sp.]
MKPSELNFITHDIIDKGTFNVTSPEMMDEARRYNMDMVTNAAIKRRTDVVTGIWFVAHLPLPFLWVCFMLANRTLSDMGAYGAGDFGQIMTYAAIGAVMLGLVAYYGLMGYYIIFRFQRDPKLVLLCSLPVLLAMFPLGFLIVGINVIMAWWYTKTDEKLSKEAGYPAFVRLIVTTVESDSKSILNLTYDSIKARTKHWRSDDEEFL